ncbi:hypothetical protein SUGI_1014900 [Cryptomeria japonica]|nr:hypothetical protein SUGI_1014900 [Cryptomeria japonica]
MGRLLINSTGAMILNINPSIPKIEVLMTRGGVAPDGMPFPLTPGQLNPPHSRMTLASVLDRFNVMTKNVETTVRATIKFVKPDVFCYPACPLKVNGK